MFTASSTRQRLKDYWSVRDKQEDATLVQSFRQDLDALLSGSDDDDKKNPDSFNQTDQKSDMDQTSQINQTSQSLLPYPNTQSALASSYISVLLHWFAAFLEADFSTKRKPYEYFVDSTDLHSLSRYDFYIDRPSYSDAPGATAPSHDHAKPQPQQFSIALLSDWASGTAESAEVADLVRQKKYSLTVHMGDTYFTGRFQDCEENFLGHSGRSVRAVQFPKGVLGTLAIPGNHEAYAHCIGFRRRIMPFCGIEMDRIIEAPGQAIVRTPREHLGSPHSQLMPGMVGQTDRLHESPTHIKQQAPFWSVELDQWLILGLDSAYHCVDIDQWNPDTNLEAANPQCRLPDLLIQWLQANFAPGMTSSPPRPADHKGLVILTHHPPMSLFDDEPVMEQLANQLAALFPGRTCMWLWGHEHQLVWYRLQTWTGLPDSSVISESKSDVGYGMAKPMAKPMTSVGLPESKTESKNSQAKHQAKQSQANRPKLHFFARCIGNGGFPVQNQGSGAKGNQTQLLAAAKEYKRHVQLIEFGPQKQQQSGKSSKPSKSSAVFGRNGYTELRFDGDRLFLEYYLLPHSGPVMREEFQVDRGLSHDFTHDFTPRIPVIRCVGSQILEKSNRYWWPGKMLGEADPETIRPGLSGLPASQAYLKRLNTAVPALQRTTLSTSCTTGVVECIGRCLGRCFTCCSGSKY